MPDGFVPSPFRQPPSYFEAAKAHGLNTGTAYDNMGYNLGTWMRDGFRNSPVGQTAGKAFNKTFSHPASGFFGGAIPGMLLGAGGQALLNYFGTQAQHRNPWLTGAMTGALGGALGGSFGNSRHHWMSKRSGAWRTGPENPYEEIFQALQGAEIPFDMKQQAFQAVGQLNPSDANQLARMLGGTFGAAAGALIVRFLSGRGLIRAAAGAIGGGLLGSMLGGALGGSFGGSSNTLPGFAF